MHDCLFFCRGYERVCHKAGGILAAFWRHAGGILAAFWRHSGGILTAFWRHSDRILTAFWRHSGSILAAFWRHSGGILATFVLNWKDLLFFRFFWLKIVMIFTRVEAFLTLFLNNSMRSISVDEVLRFLTGSKKIIKNSDPPGSRTCHCQLEHQKEIITSVLTAFGSLSQSVRALDTRWRTEAIQLSSDACGWSCSDGWLFFCFIFQNNSRFEKV